MHNQRETPIGQGAASRGYTNVSLRLLNDSNVVGNSQPTVAEVLLLADRALVICHEELRQVDIQRRRLESDLSDLNGIRSTIIEQGLAIKSLIESLLQDEARWQE